MEMQLDDVIQKEYIYQKMLMRMESELYMIENFEYTQR